MWWLTEFNGVKIPAGNFDFDATRSFANAYFTPTGTPFGAYRLDGVKGRMGAQAVTYEFTYPSKCNFATQFTTLLSAAQSEGVLKKSDGQRTLQTVGSINSVSDRTTMDDYIAGLKRARIELTTEPFWYSTTTKLVSFSNTPVLLNTAARRNEGNARAVKHMVLSIANSITASLELPFIITITPTVGTTAILNITASLGPPVVIDVGAHTVSAEPEDLASYRHTSRGARQLPLLFLEGQYLLNGQLTANNATLSFTRDGSPVITNGTLQFRDTWV